MSCKSYGSSNDVVSIEEVAEKSTPVKGNMDFEEDLKEGGLRGWMTLAGV